MPTPTPTAKAVTRDTLNGAVDFYHPFTLTPASPDQHPGVALITDAPSGLYAPTVSLDASPGGDVTVDDTRWTPLTGHTGQYGYDGAVMHPSEQLAGGMADAILSAPGATYVVVEVTDEDGDYPDASPIGWAILRYTGTPTH